MNKLSINRKPGKMSFIIVGIIALLLMSIIFLWAGNLRSIQSETSVIAGVEFEGQYKIGDGEWQDFVKGEHIPSTKGDVTFRGIFLMINPMDNTPVGPLAVGTTINLYLNHIGGYTSLPNGYSIPFDVENNTLGEDACAAAWGGLPATGGETVTFVLRNPHKYGNENAIDELFENLSIAPGIYHESMVLEKGESERTIGLFILIFSLIIIGIAAFSTLIHIKHCAKMWLIGLASISASGYMMFNAFAVSVWNDSNITNTRMLGLCMMFYMLFSTMLVTTMLKGRIKHVALLATFISAVAIVFCISASLFKGIKFYDTWAWWTAVETVVAVILAVCLIRSFKGSTLFEKLSNISALFMLAAFCLDAVATAIGWWEGGQVSKFVFFAVFILGFIVVLRIIPANINAAMRAQELEAEQQALKLELQENRISIMLSQMQPHFIFNTLNTIYHLCEIDPDKARNTISSFSDYLRNNIDNLAQSEMISFEKELSFVKTYLDIEKVRFDDELLISFDIAATNFKLPVLTVEPIVENAVKHGTSKKEGVSYLFISTRETDTDYEIEIRDTGAGFDSSYRKDDGHKHIGISSVKQRLEALCDGTLTIESEIGKGTTATIRIPKKEAPKV